MKKKFIALLLLIALCGCSFSLAFAAENSKLKPLPPGAIVLQKATADVTGDGKKDTITLAGQKFDATSVYIKSLYLLVNDTIIKFPSDSDGGMETKFILKDFNGDKIPDIFVSSATGGSGGIMYYHIYSLKGGKVNLLFSPTPDSAIIIKGFYQSKYKVRMTIQQTKKTYTFDFSERKIPYDDPNVKLYNNGKLLKNESVTTDYYGLLTPIDADKDGVYELQGIQAIWGVAHADTLAQVKSTWKWVNGKWNVIKADVDKVGDTSADSLDGQKALLTNIMNLAKEGKIINCEFPVKTICEEDIEKKLGKPDKTEWIPDAKGTYATFSKLNLVFGFNKGSQVFEARTFDLSLGKIKLSTVKALFGKPPHDVKTGGQKIIGYTAGKEFKLLLVYPQITKDNPDPFMDHYSVLYPAGTVNSMADDPGRQW